MGVCTASLLTLSLFYFFMIYMFTGKKLSQLKLLLYLAGFLWIAHVIGYIFPTGGLGIIPREPGGLPGIIFAPFIHADFSHLIANSISLIILGFILASTEENGIIYILLSVMLLGGLGTWVIGRSGTVHIGASGVIYGILGYLIARGFFRKDFKSVIVSVIVLFMYGGMIFGVLPTVPHMSWESHLCGFLAGIITAASGKKRR